ncbi:MAG TPA: CoA-transferase [Actinomycetes bacterium]|nr:CoA-transferase [Actinomycetes bacterium]
MSREFTIDEWVCAAMAGTIGDGEVVFHGFGSPCATVAMHLAKRTHAPHMVLVEGATYALDPDPAFIPPTSNDWALMRRAAHVLRFEELFDLAARGGLDRMFLSGAQIDAYGNTNVTAIGSLEAPKVKLGGGGGGCNLSATVQRTTLWTTHHRSGRALVGRCDVLTDVGHVTPEGTRAELGFPGRGPGWLVTELGVFDFPDGRARLRQVYPDVSLDEVRAATGFELDVDPGLRALPPPDPAAIALVRRLDPLRVRRREFSEQELNRRFRWADDGRSCTACL